MDLKCHYEWYDRVVKSNQIVLSPHLRYKLSINITKNEIYLNVYLKILIASICLCSSKLYKEFKHTSLLVRNLN